MGESTGSALATWAKTGVQRVVEKAFRCQFIDSPDEEAVYLSAFPRSIQLDDYSCGVQVMRSVLAYYGEDVDAFLFHWDNEDRGGMDTPAIENVLTENGLECKEFYDDDDWSEIHNAIDKGHPVIVCLDDSEHWAIVFGYSDQYIYLMDPDPRDLFGTQISHEKFASRWDGWGMSVKAK
jgi:ABC-type bacteriocin/lantibiotic exporter with double-glycine peptidase domain